MNHPQFCCECRHGFRPPTINIPQIPDKHILKTKTKDNIRLNHSDTRTKRIGTKKQTHLSVDPCTYRRQSSLVRPSHRLQNEPAAPLASWNNQLDQRKWNDCVGNKFKGKSGGSLTVLWTAGNMYTFKKPSTLSLCDL